VCHREMGGTAEGKERGGGVCFMVEGQKTRFKEDEEGKEGSAWEYKEGTKLEERCIEAKQVRDFRTKSGGGESNEQAKVWKKGEITDGQKLKAGRTEETEFQ